MISDGWAGASPGVTDDGDAVRPGERTEQRGERSSRSPVPAEPTASIMDSKTTANKTAPDPNQFFPDSGPGSMFDNVQYRHNSIRDRATLWDTLSARRATVSLGPRHPVVT
jgi:hypothetical protein